MCVRDVVDVVLVIVGDGLVCWVWVVVVCELDVGEGVWWNMGLE